MILILTEGAEQNSAEFRELTQRLAALPNITSRVHQIRGTERTVTEIYLLGDTKALQLEDMRAMLVIDLSFSCFFEVYCQNTFNGHNDLNPHFGLGDATIVEEQ